MKNFKKKLASLMAFTMLFSCVSFMSANAESTTGKSEIYSKVPSAGTQAEYSYDITDGGAGLTGEVKLEYDATILNETNGDTFIGLASGALAVSTKVESANFNAALKFNTLTTGTAGAQGGIIAPMYKESSASSWSTKGVIPLDYLKTGRKMHIVTTANTETKAFEITVDGKTVFAETDSKLMRNQTKAADMSKFVVMGANAEQFKLTNVTITANGKTRNITEPVAAPTIVSATPSTISVKYGTSLEALKAKLPTTGKLKLSDDSTIDAPVTWTEGDYQKTTPGTYTWTGTVTPPVGTENPSNITTTTLEITVGPAPTNTLAEWPAVEPKTANASAHEIPMQEGTSNYEFWVNISEKDLMVVPTLNSIIAFGGEENVMPIDYPGTKMPIVIRAWKNTAGSDIYFDAFNGGAGAKAVTVPIEANGKYKVNVSIDATNHHFDVSVNGIQIADDYAYRTNVTAPAAITKVAVFGNAAGNANELKVTSFKINGALYGAFESAATLDIAAVSPIAEKSVAAGTAFDALALPAAVKVTTSGAPTSVGVTWEQGTYDAQKPGTYTITGTLATTEGITNTQNVKAQMVVSQGIKTITAIAPAESVKVVTGTKAEELKLPATVTATFDDKTTAEVAVTWDTTNYSPENGEYTLTGTITAPENTKNTSNLTAEVVVTVAEKSEEPAGDFQALTEALDSAKFLLDDTTKSIHPKAKLYLEETIEAAETFQTETPSATEEEVLTQAGIVNQAREYAEAADLTEIEAIVAELAASDVPSATPYAALAQTRLDELKALDFVVDAEVVTLYKDMISNYAEVVNAGTADIEGLETRVASLEAEVATGKYHVSLDAWTDWARTLLTALQESTWVPSTEEIAACESVVATAEGLLTTTEISAINALVEEVLNMGTEAEGYAWASFIQLRLQDPYLDAASLAEYQSILEGFLA